VKHVILGADAVASYRKRLASVQDRGRPLSARAAEAADLGESLSPLLDHVEAVTTRLAELEAGRPDPPDLEARGLEESDVDAWYCVALSGEGGIAKVVQGWGNALELIRREMWMGGEAPPDEWGEWLAQLNDESEWSRYEGSPERFHFSSDVGECSRLHIYRLWVPPIAASAVRPTPPPAAATRIFRLRRDYDVTYEEAASLADLEREVRSRRAAWDQYEVRELEGEEARIKPFRVTTEEYPVGSGATDVRGLARGRYVVAAVDERDAENLWKASKGGLRHRFTGARLLSRDELAMLFPRDFGPEGARDVDGWVAKRGGRRGVLVPLG